MVEIVNYYDKKIISKAVQILSRGGVIVFPTETVYAIAADAANDGAIKKIQHFKSREIRKPFSIFVSDIYQAKSVAEMNESAVKLFSRFFPGPLTIILKKSENSSISKFVNQVEDTIGIRMPDHALSMQILKAFGRPIVATSANISGKNEDSIYSQKVIENFPDVDLIIDTGETEYKNFSTVVDLSSGEINILREGVIKGEQVLKALS